MGINLASINDYSAELVFVDVMNQSRTWITHDLAPGSPWSSGVQVPLGPNGYPLEIPYDNGVNPPQGIRTLMYFGSGVENIYPEGNYTLKVEGTGIVRLWGGAAGTFNCPIETTVSVTNGAGIALEIEESQASDPIRNISFVMPGFEDVYQTAPYHPELLSFLEDFQVIRFMNWTKTNNSEVAQWTDRNQLGNYTQTLEQGVAYEHIIALCNALQKDAWINIPHQADDNFITEFARLFRDLLDPNLKIYVEYSNEVWNGIFSQNSYAADQGLQLGYTGESWERTWKYTAKRSADVFQIFENEFVNDSRFIKVIPGFAANSWVTNYIIDRFNEPFYNPTQVGADAVAIAPYFGGGVANAIGDQGLENTITVQAILDSLVLSLPQAQQWMAEARVVADAQNLELIAYEGGQHLVAGWPYSQNQSFVDKLSDANRDPQMQAIYCDYFDAWYNSISGGMFAHYSSHRSAGQYGAWGLKESFADVFAPKYLAMQNCIFNDSPLPVELLDFAGYKVADGVKLRWETTNEINHQGFEIQRSTNGNEWRTIGFVAGKGNTDDRNNYEYWDRNPDSGENYYRLKQIDFDGLFKYSEVIKFDLFGSTKILNVYPNPSNGLIQVHIDYPSPHNLVVKVHDSFGRIVWESKATAGELDWRRTINLEIDGLYIISTQIGNEVFNRKVMVSGKR